jgi:hypothetical protein
MAMRHVETVADRKPSAARHARKIPDILDAANVMAVELDHATTVAALELKNGVVRIV